MADRFIRCPLCGYPHEEAERVCPVTGGAIPRKEATTGSLPKEVLARKIRPLSSLRTGTPAKMMGSIHKPTPHQAIKPAVQTAPAKPKHDLLGATLDKKYLVRGVLGEGGMGTVFEAEHLGIGRTVAVKVLSSQQAQKRNAVKRFQNEARAAGAIGHPNICEVYDLGTLPDERPYLVMEKLSGETLADRLMRNGGLPVDEVLDIMIQVLSGLHAAHKKGIVHRDMKPENVFLSERVGCPPVAKILDFGVSKFLGHRLGGKDDDLDLTKTGMVMGTPYYMAPEQIRGERNLDARVDIYACGIVLYEALTGKRPFVANNYQALIRLILAAKPRPLHELRPNVGRALERVIERAMAPDREARYPGAAELQHQLLGLHADSREASRLSSDSRSSTIPPPPSRTTSTPPAVPAVRVPRAPQSRPGRRTRAASSLEIPVLYTDEAQGGGLDDGPTLIDKGTPFDGDRTERMGPDVASELARSVQELSGEEGDATMVTAPPSAVLRRRKDKGVSPDDTVKIEGPPDTES